MFMSAVPPGSEVQKTQAIRGLDVWIIGPMMIMGGRCLGGTKGTLLKLMGFGTIAYNWANWYNQSQKERTV